MAEEAGAWHGWSNGEVALFITPTPDEEHVGLYIQQQRSTELAAIFVDPAMAQLAMDWMDEALTKTGEANTALLARLRHEQPLLFARPAGPPPTPPEDEDDDGGD